MSRHIGFDNPKETVESFIGQYDLVSYEFIKMIRLLLRSNPNVFSILHLNSKHYLYVSKEAQLILDNRDDFNSLLAYKSYVGYASTQLHKMKKNIFEGYMGSRRKELVKNLVSIQKWLLMLYVY